jgi:hypothetical protein
MAGRGRFRYALEPVRLARQWELDGLLVELAAANAAMAAHRQDLQALLDRMAAAEQEWRHMGQGTVVPAGRYMLLSYYIGDCRLRVPGLEAKVHDALRVRDLLIERVIAARKALDAVEEHRDKMKALDVRWRKSVEYKETDERLAVLDVVQARKNDDQD